MSAIPLFLACVWGLNAPAAEGELPPAARKALEAEDWPAVIRHLGPAAGDADNALANHFVGLAYYAQDKRSEAVAHLTRALRADPTCRPTALLLARCAAREGGGPYLRLPKYVGELEEAWGFDGDVLHCIGAAWMNTYLWKLRKAVDMYARDKGVALARAVDYFRRAEAVGTTFADNARWLALLQYRDGRYAEAVEHARRAVRAGPAGYEVHVILGGALARLGRLSEAEAAFDRARRLAPGKVGVVEYERGKALCGAGYYNEAVEALRRTLSARRELHNVRHWIGAAAFGGRDYRLALWGFVESHKVDERIDDLYYIGRCADALGRYDLAEQYCRRAIDAYLGKAKARGAKDAQSPTMWLHYLGRAKWHQGKHAEALKDLRGAFDRAKTSRLYACWLYRAYLARDDVHGALGVCRELGRYSRYRDDAVAGVLTILEKWPKPRMGDFLLRRKPHTYVAWDILGDLYGYKGRPFTAVHYYDLARRTRGPAVRSVAGWALVHCHRYDRAEQAFRDCIRYQKNKDFGRWGLGSVLMATGRWAEADKTLAAITRESMLPGRDAGRLYAAVAAGEPAARTRADAYTLLGLIHNRHLGAGKGIQISFLVPGGVLDRARPRLRARDVLLAVGEAPLGGTEQLAAFRKGKVPDAPVEALVRRGTHRFGVTLDYPAVVGKLPAATRPAGKEVAR